ncbi:MAG TPA: N-acetylmuramoyl-L-alanine amidase [Myxococcota bacterium]|nr:N-acetylmuramoyl-L-alanine amidase [Myxococcota bacterium]
MKLRTAALAACVCAAALAFHPARAEDGFDTVVIDPGHGGEDSGARGPGGTLEKDLVLRVARALGERLAARGLRVVQTRTRDVFVPLEQRTAIANDARGDLFVSIHANAAEDATSRGTETYFLALSPSDASAERVAKRENEAFGQAAGGIAAVNDPFVALVGDLIATEHLQESSLLAHAIQAQLSGLSPRSRGVKQALFVVLTGVQMPASLVEIGFVTSAEEEAHMKSADGLREIVAALERGIVEYGRGHAQRLGGSAPARPAESP